GGKGTVVRVLRSWARHAPDPEVLARREVGIESPSQLLVEAPRPVDVGDGRRYHLELRVRNRVPPGIGCAVGTRRDAHLDLRCRCGPRGHDQAIISSSIFEAAFGPIPVEVWRRLSDRQAGYWAGPCRRTWTSCAQSSPPGHAGTTARSIGRTPRLSTCLSG